LSRWGLCTRAPFCESGTAYKKKCENCWNRKPLFIHGLSYVSSARFSVFIDAKRIIGFRKGGY
jgi:hypothetical protein